MGAAACSGVSTIELNPAPAPPAPAPGGANDHGSGVVPANDPCAAGERELSIAPASFGGPALAFRGRLALEIGLLVMVPDPGVAEVEVEAEAGRRGTVTLELDMDVGGARSATPRGVGAGVGAGAVATACDVAKDPGPDVEEGPAFELLLPARAALNREVFFFAAIGALSSTVEGGAEAGGFAKEVDEARTWDGDPVSMLSATTGGPGGAAGAGTG